MATYDFTNTILFKSDSGLVKGLQVNRVIENQQTSTFSINIYQDTPIIVAPGAFLFDLKYYWSILSYGEEKEVYRYGNKYITIDRRDWDQLVISFYIGNNVIGTPNVNVNFSLYEYLYFGIAYGYFNGELNSFRIEYSHVNGVNYAELSITNYKNYDPSQNNAYMNQWLPDYIASDDPYATNDNHTPSGGYGPQDYTSEIETPPGLPSLSAAQVGFVSLWNPSQSEMKDLATYLWTGTFDLTNFKKLFTDPMECILSVGMIPITPTRKQSGGTDVKEEIVFGGSSHSGVNAYPVTEQFYIVDMGTLHIEGKSASAMDYSPYCKASIYLPYCGTYALDVDEIMDSDLELEYHIDIYTGACVAYLTVNGHINSDNHSVHAIMYQFTGNVLASIPITGNDHSQFIQSMLFMGASVAATVATSGAGSGAALEGLAAEGDIAAGGSALNAVTAGSAINTVMSMKPNVLHSGNLSSTAGLLGGQKPFVTMTWSNLCRPDDEYKLAGMPLHKSGTLSDFEGFTIVSACHMDNILCTDAERAMIEQALAKGVII